jgi:uncharacterized protein
MTQSQSYLSISYQAKKYWWLYLIGIIFIYDDSFNFIERWFTIIFGAFANNSLILNYATNKMIPLFKMIKLFAMVVYVHKRNFKSLIRISEMIRWKRILLGFSASLVIELIFIGFHYINNPQNFILSFTNDWFIFLPIALVLTTLQTSFEELFFRGYLLQGMATICQNRPVLIIINGLLFTFAHIGNPELQRGWILLFCYFIVGAFLAYLTIRDNGLELALGIHAAHNLLIVLFFNTKDSISITPSIWQISPLAPSVDVGLLILEYAILYYIFFGIKKSPKTLAESD